MFFSFTKFATIFPELFPDELRVPWLSPGVPDIRLVGNLPFNVATPLVIRLLRSMQRKDNVFSYGRVPMLLTFQVGEKHCEKKLLE